MILQQKIEVQSICTVLYRGTPIGLREDVIGPFFVRENENRRFM